MFYIVHYGTGGELERRTVETEADIAAELATMGPFAEDDVIHIERV